MITSISSSIVLFSFTEESKLGQTHCFPLFEGTVLIVEVENSIREHSTSYSFATFATANWSLFSVVYFPLYATISPCDIRIIRIRSTVDFFILFLHWTVTLFPLFLLVYSSGHVEPINYTCRHYTWSRSVGSGTLASFSVAQPIT